jgi:hypothetical protein
MKRDVSKSPVPFGCPDKSFEGEFRKPERKDQLVQRTNKRSLLRQTVEAFGKVLHFEHLICGCNESTKLLWGFVVAVHILNECKKRVAELVVDPKAIVVYIIRPQHLRD